ncbi:FAD-binding oxidoreductase [Mucilaginibacter terrenus]|uniref:FAD-binding oxidoreductase n=1 Tax=Mucilaginibacter terrenus TaxID=2482727 RepID=A0A3E2NPF0_9SPHI|nr:FAD-dependent oxidoreductase [Mucilaginibacter terrenus]RFZ82886.1 FAD-binding oxidoreductase [Mucilaginibacter terrenus]
MDGANFSYWERTAFTGNADVIVIGSGLVGLSAALHLKQCEPELKVLVLERGFLPSGASTKNAGFACFGTVSEQLEALKHAPEEEVARLAAYKWKGLHRLRKNLGDANIDYQQHGGNEIFFAEQKSHAEECIDKISLLNNLLRNAIGATDIYSVANSKISDFGIKGVSHMIYNAFEGQLHTGKMMRTLLNRVYAEDIMVLNNCEINTIDEDSSGILLQTSNGLFKSTKVIVATNAFVNQLYPELDVVPGRGQVLVTKPVQGLKLKGTYHFNEGYYYFRNIDGRVLFGGGRNLDFKDEETHQFGHTDVVRQSLLTYLKDNILPDQPFEVEQWWSGIMGFGGDISPIVKQVKPNVFCAVRCNGMGVAMGSLVGEEVADLLLKS